MTLVYNDYIIRLNENHTMSDETTTTGAEMPAVETTTETTTEATPAQDAPAAE